MLVIDVFLFLLEAKMGFTVLEYAKRDLISFKDF